ncbi:alpha/beta hydrolase fold domain-containing protein [Pseudomonas sp. RTC3]|uniref:flavin-containing monooxygenase n=1 Tax=Pseudomonas sp. 5C2 TaxID=3048588 RepID=UPI002AB45397|nr:alpha/beta hydrolase fold domain-containing protein [Pseudomonas sp. 5C2]MDY7564594.1 alpha/beta hydrolase fold domain-containing protein [Pseudomonas sp. 5C2]MEB0060760.1 alpha/beta hydrolase fold domain-containing protein [Pseudomonas sp. RTC3]
MSLHDFDVHLESATPLTAIIIGTGFAGIGMAVALQKAGVKDFVILEKKHDVGGVWRDNSYPGAACDVPSHLYSFSFELNPDWSRVFAPQGEIHAYLRRCADKYGLGKYIRFGAEVASAEFDEVTSLWQVTQKNGSVLSASLLISGTGQLSRPAFPKLAGMDTFKGHVFHSATWDHSYSLAGKRVAVVGTGASAIQFVPAIAEQVEHLKVFQRSPAHMIPRPDRAYSEREKSLLRNIPWTMTAYRASIYMRYESRALAFTRFKGLMKWAVGIPFRKLLTEQVTDPVLREKLTPDYPFGCKRILLSSEYLKIMNRSNVELITDGIVRVIENGIETADGEQHEVDAIIYGTGFAATEFLSPMRIVGRGGVDLNHVWRDGTRAYLGLTVPNFPNFFMLYGPNTNLGHNSIVYMLESQIAHVMRCWRTLNATGANTVEVDQGVYERFHGQTQKRLANTVWNGCKSWYVDDAGNNSTNWPGFTLSYRWLTRFSGLHAYRFSRQFEGGTTIAESRDWPEVLNALFLRGFLRATFRSLIGPGLGVVAQRRVVSVLSGLMPGITGVNHYRQQVNGVPVQVVAPKQGENDGVILYLHGGAFCLGSPDTHWSVTSRLAKASGMSVWVADYRLAPEHPCPAALDDALACYEALRAQGYAANRIFLAGDSAGAALVLALALKLRDRYERFAAGLLLMSPVTDEHFAGASMTSRLKDDPMIRRGWLEQGLGWYASNEVMHSPLQVDLYGLPPMLVQVGDHELLLSDSTRLAEHAVNSGVDCRLEVYAGRWHVFQLQAFYLRSAAKALNALGAFAREQLASAKPEAS